MGSSTSKTRSGLFTGDGAAKKVVLGFKPKTVKLYNVTDQIDYKKTETMALDKARKEIATGVKTFVDAVTLNADGFTINATENVAAKSFHYEATQSESED